MRAHAKGRDLYFRIPDVGGLDGDVRRQGCRGVAPHGVDRAQT